MIRIPEYQLLARDDQARAFGLLCAARLSVVAGVRPNPVADELESFIRSMGGGISGLPGSVTEALVRYSERYEILDDVKALWYFQSLAVHLVLVSMGSLDADPVARAKRSMFIAMTAWRCLDDILDRCRGRAARYDDAYVGELLQLEISQQIEDAQSLIGSADVVHSYLERLESTDNMIVSRRAVASEIGQFAGW
jgi:hypothetical protein